MAERGENIEEAAERRFLELYDACADAIFRHCYFRIGNRDDAKEMMQETFMRAWKYMADGREVTYARALLYRIAHNLVIDYYREKKTSSLDVMEEDGFDPPAKEGADTVLRAIEERELINAIMTGLDPVSAQAVLMRHVDGLSPREIATYTGETENVISVRIHRGIKKIRKIYGI